MARRLPPMNALKSFEAAARHESFTRAAEELCVTQGAVSHQVKALEEELGLKLFHRAPQHLILTEAGREYSNVVRDALDRISVGTDKILQRQNSGVLTVSTSPNFAAKWLVHRLGKFAEAYPDIDLRISATLHHVDFANEDVDMAVRHSDGEVPGLDVEQLYEEQLFPVCSPKLLESPPGLKKPEDLIQHPLLHLDNRQDWTKWLDVAGVKGADLSRGPVLNQASMIIDAAVDGQGVALARTALASHDLINGRLVRPFPIALPVNYGYWVVYPKATANQSKIKLFRDWLLAEVADDMKRLKEL
ncbi:MAG: transcriptional regulator GcvA [Magnetovibrio sp.]|nr:transcriptional regulator GcvA [Magnetovibrio sp.]